ncbi:MAG: ABC transporter transmembrane domain-containing protein [Stappiaceae bacterium]
MREPEAETTSDSNVKKNKNQRRSVRPLAALWPYLMRYRGRVVVALISLVAAAAVTLTLPLAIRRMIDFGFEADNTGFIDRYFGMLVLVAAALAAASSFRYYFVTWIGERIVADVRRDVFAHVTSLDTAFFDQARSGEVISRLTADTTQVKAAVGASASIALRNLVLCIGAIAMMFVTSPRLTGLVLLAIPFIVLPLIAFGRSVRRKSRLAQDTLAEATAFATEAIGAVRTLQAFTNEQFANRRFGTDVDRAFEAARSSVAARAGLTAFAIFIVFSSVVAVLWIGAQDVLAGNLSAGTLSQFVLYSVFAAGALGALSQVWGEVSQAAGATERLTELLATPAYITAPENPIDLPVPTTGAIAMEDVSFSYPTLPDAPVLHDIDLTIEPGETLAIVGPSGSGKSTIFSLLMRGYDPLSGTIKIDGVSLQQTDPLELRRQIAIVPQDTVIFADTAMENIRFGRPDATDEEVRKAAELALADDFIRTMSNGYHSVIGERGVTLSGGQRQRMAIARAILKDAPVLLLDEATSALDAESETLVQTALERLMENRTTLVIAHRLATVLKADRIIVLDKGRIVETGNHRSLVASDGLYARLARMQFESGARALSDLDLKAAE